MNSSVRIHKRVVFFLTLAIIFANFPLSVFAVHIDGITTHSSVLTGDAPAPSTTIDSGPITPIGPGGTLPGQPAPNPISNPSGTTVNISGSTPAGSGSGVAPPPSTSTANPFYENCGVKPNTWHWCMVGWYYSLIYTPSAGILTISGNIMDIMLSFSLSKDVMNASFVQGGWESTRDLANMFFIFVLLFIAIATILQLSSYGAKALLAKLIIFALIINFSLFISRAIIDSGNITATFFYDAISAPAPTTGGLSSIGGVPIKSISVGLVRGADPQKLVGQELFDSWIAEKQELGTLFMIYLSATTVNLVLAWVLVSVALLFIARVAVLWFLMAVAPLAFVAMILPQTNGIAKKWWGELFNKTFCIAVFMFFLWLVLILLNSEFVERIFSGAVVKTTTETLLRIFLNFAVVVVLLQMAKKITMKMCGEIEGVALNIGSKLAGVAGLALGGVGGAVLRGTVGKGAAMLARNQTLMDAASRKGVVGSLARIAHKGTIGTATGSMDFRAGLGKIPGADKLGLKDFGKAGGKGGFEKRVMDKAKAEAGYARTRLKYQNEADWNKKGPIERHMEQSFNRTFKLLARQRKGEDVSDLLKIEEDARTDLHKELNNLKNNSAYEARMREEAYANALALKGKNWLSRSDMEASNMIRKGKGPNDDLIEAIKNMQTPPPAPPSGNTH